MLSRLLLQAPTSPPSTLTRPFPAVLKESPKVRNLAMLVVSYSVSHRLFEFAWKGALRTLHPTPGAYQSVLADVAIATGYATIALMLLSRYVFQYAGWAAAAAATPTVMLVTGGAFFGLSIAAGAGLTLGSLGPLQLAALGVGTGVATQVCGGGVMSRMGRDFGLIMCSMCAWRGADEAVAEGSRLLQLSLDSFKPTLFVGPAYGLVPPAHYLRCTLSSRPRSSRGRPSSACLIRPKRWCTLR